ncbi:MAG: 2Fe-2S iron-sulfur cluster binding domain-containing protein [Alphaproteobacteria bacterium]
MSDFTIEIAGVESQVPAGADETVLDACLRAGLAMPYNCRSGECGECIAALEAGEVEEMPGADPAVFTDVDRRHGRILTCMCFPRSDLRLALALRDGVAAPRIERVHAMVEAIDWHGPNIAEVALSTPGALDYRAGQYFEWVLPGITPDRSFSAANRAGSDVIRFHVRLYPDGAVGRYINEEMTVGGIVELVGPYGHFGFSENDHRPAICVAGGTGMAPIRAVLDEAFARGDGRPIRYFYGARSQADLYALDDIAAWQEAQPQLRFTPVLSEEPDGSDWPGARGLVTDVLAAEMGDAFGAEAFLCGPPAMIDAAIEVLLTAGLDEADIYYDKFTPTR